MRINRANQYANHRTNLPLWLLFCCSLFITAACSGFKPRTENAATQVPLYGQAVNIAENKLRAGFVQLLQQGLRDSGARLVDKATPGVIAVNITGLEEDKTVSAYSSVRQVREFNHYIELDFTAERIINKQTNNKAAKTKMLAAKVRAERTQIYDSRFVLGVSEEERTIRDELRLEAVRLLALRLSVL